MINQVFLMFSSFPSAVLLLHNRTQSICTMPVTLITVRYLLTYNATPLFWSLFVGKKSVSMSFLMKNNFLEKFSSNVKFTVALHAQKSVTGVDTNNLMFCLFSDKSSFLMFSSFPSAVLLLHNRTQSICTMPVTFFYEWGVLGMN